MKVSELTGAMLDYWVARAEGYAVIPAPTDPQGCWVDDGGTPFPFAPSTDWRQGGPIIDCERYTLASPHDDVPEQRMWQAWCRRTGGHWGPTPLVAAMRAFVASKYGDEVPNEVSP